MGLIYGPFGLELDILNHCPAPSELELYNNTYGFWKNSWNQTFQELKSGEVVNGDDFCVLDEVAIIHKRKSPVAIMGLRWYDLNLYSHIDAEYIRAFSEAAVAKLKEHHLYNILSIGHLVVDPDFRKENCPISMKDLMTSLSLRRFTQSKADAVVALTRNNKGINKLFSRFGAEALVTAEVRHNVEVDMMVLFPKKYRESNLPGVAETSRLIWNQWLSRSQQRVRKNDKSAVS